uniref:uncharacterized protein LOC122607115 n=1 Tax=Erigeron canadensis TaxID=72917 RepID=UPI001CB9D64E|nr:uncharacterized protein LOC122607115 [Erigeron canadensis]
MATLLLPSFFMLHSGGKYLSLTENNPPTANLPSGILKFDEQTWTSPRTKFAAEPAAGGLYHIRSVYNNKYLVIIGSSNSWIVASAKKPEEDTSKGASCTLFEPYSLPNDDQTTITATVRLRHVGTGISATLSPGPADDDDDDDHGVLLLSSSTSTTGSSFILRDSETALVLPSRVAFRSQDINNGDNYLGSIWLYGKFMYQQFRSGLDIGDPRVSKELLPINNEVNYYHIMDLYNGRLWTRADGWIRADVDDPSLSDSFSFVQIKDNVFALRSYGGVNQYFCGPYTEDASVNCLNAAYPSISKETRLVIEEAVLEREIKDVEYRIGDSRVYDEQPVEVDHEYGTNNLPTDTSMTLEFTTTDSRTTSWNNSVSVQLGVKVTFETTYVPFIAKSTVELSAEFGYTHEWGGEVTTQHERKSSYTVTVSPMKTVKVTMLATTGKCDVPFSYTQRDLLPSGEWVETRKDDGIFKGLNSYDIHYKSEEVDPDDQE